MYPRACRQCNMEGIAIQRFLNPATVLQSGLEFASFISKMQRGAQ